jgi:hypothetical protein
VASQIIRIWLANLSESGYPAVPGSGYDHDMAAAYLPRLIDDIAAVPIATLAS